MKKIKIDRAIQERPATRKQTRNEKIRQSLTEHVDVQVIPAITDREGYEKPKLRVCAYCRVSTDMDTQALSYELQVQNYTDYIRGNDEWQFAGIYADRGISGTSLKHRDEFNRMIEDCKAGKIDLIITKAVTRFARNVLDCISTIRMLKQLEHPVAVYFETERINTLDTTSETYLGLISLFAQGESESKSESLKWSYIRRWKRGTGIYPTWSLLGYEMGEDGKWQIVEAEAELVRIIYDMYLNGYADVNRHYQTIRKYAQSTGRNFYAFGWLLDISRCLYTLRTGRIISKTKAAAWALQNDLCPDVHALTTALDVRRCPLKYRDDQETFDYAETLGEPVQRFADVLEQELKAIASEEAKKSN